MVVSTVSGDVYRLSVDYEVKILSKIPIQLSVPDSRGLKGSSDDSVLFAVSPSNRPW